MKALVTLLAVLGCSWQGLTQNVGIGNQTPNAPLQFANNTLNRKIVLYEYVNNDHEFYGFGLNSGVLRYQTATSSDDHVFYSGTNGTSSRELMRIKGSGLVGVGAADPAYPLDVNGRIRIRGGGDDNSSAGIWLNSNTNNALQAFVGITQSNVGFYGGNAGWGLMMSTENGNVGIGNSVPYSPLSFKQALGKKISLYPGPSGDAGFGVWGNELRIHSDNPNAAITFGYDSYNDPKFTESMRITGAGNIGMGNSDPGYRLDLSGRMRIRSGGSAATSAGIWLNNVANSSTPAFIGMQSDNMVGFYGSGAGWGLAMNTQTGSMAFDGNAGTNGEVLLSRGAALPPTWQGVGSQLPFYTASQQVRMDGTAKNYSNLNINFSVGRQTRVLLWFTTSLSGTGTCVVGPCPMAGRASPVLDGAAPNFFEFTAVQYPGGGTTDARTFGPVEYIVGAGSHHLTFSGRSQIGVFDMMIIASVMLIPL